jgi:hypothetical protein
MATPWQQAQHFAQKKWRRLKRMATNAPPTRPLEIVDEVAQAWINTALPNMGCPAWVFVYAPHGNGLYEWADNFDHENSEYEVAGRYMLGLHKLHSIKSSDGMMFIAMWIEGRLEIPAVALIHSEKLFVFDKPDGQSPPLTEEGWDRYVY